MFRAGLLQYCPRLGEIDANRYGSERGIDFTGSSQIVAPAAISFTAPGRTATTCSPST